MSIEPGTGKGRARTVFSRRHKSHRSFSIGSLPTFLFDTWHESKPTTAGPPPNFLVPRFFLFQMSKQEQEGVFWMILGQRVSVRNKQ